MLMLNVYSVIIRWKVESICFLNAVSVIEFGSFVCSNAEWKSLLFYGERLCR
jgi:hypothetical protein